MKYIILNFIALFIAFNLYANVIINELNYNPAVEGDTTEFIELWNTGDEIINISGWFFSNGVDYVFDDYSLLLPNEFLIIARYTNEFNEAYPNVINVHGPFANGTKLSNSGELITLCDSGIVIAFSKNTYCHDIAD